jgi:hypothetical protein
MEKYGVGGIKVCPKGTENPYTVESEYTIGEERVKALITFMNGDQDENLELWYTPTFGGAKKITAEEVNWEQQMPEEFKGIKIEEYKEACARIEKRKKEEVRAFWMKRNPGYR